MILRPEGWLLMACLLCWKRCCGQNTTVVSVSPVTFFQPIPVSPFSPFPVTTDTATSSTVRTVQAFNLNGTGVLSGIPIPTLFPPVITPISDTITRQVVTTTSSENLSSGTPSLDHFTITEFDDSINALQVSQNLNKQLILPSATSRPGLPAQQPNIGQPINTGNAQISGANGLSGQQAAGGLSALPQNGNTNYAVQSGPGSSYGGGGQSQPVQQQQPLQIPQPVQSQQPIQFPQPVQQQPQQQFSQPTSYGGVPQIQSQPVPQQQQQQQQQQFPVTPTGSYGGGAQGTQQQVPQQTFVPSQIPNSPQPFGSIGGGSYGGANGAGGTGNFPAQGINQIQQNFGGNSNQFPVNQPGNVGNANQGSQQVSYGGNIQAPNQNAPQNSVTPIPTGFPAAAPFTPQPLTGFTAAPTLPSISNLGALGAYNQMTSGFPMPVGYYAGPQQSGPGGLVMPGPGVQPNQPIVNSGFGAANPVQNQAPTGNFNNVQQQTGNYNNGQQPTGNFNNGQQSSGNYNTNQQPSGNFNNVQQQVQQQGYGGLSGQGGGYSGNQQQNTGLSGGTAQINTAILGGVQNGQTYGQSFPQQQQQPQPLKQYGTGPFGSAAVGQYGSSAGNQQNFGYGGTNQIQQQQQQPQQQLQQQQQQLQQQPNVGSASAYGLGGIANQVQQTLGNTNAYGNFGQQGQQNVQNFGTTNVQQQPQNFQQNQQTIQSPPAVSNFQPTPVPVFSSANVASALGASIQNQLNGGSVSSAIQSSSNLGGSLGQNFATSSVQISPQNLQQTFSGSLNSATQVPPNFPGSPGQNFATSQPNIQISPQSVLVQNPATTTPFSGFGGLGSLAASIQQQLGGIPSPGVPTQPSVGQQTTSINPFPVIAPLQNTAAPTSANAGISSQSAQTGNILNTNQLSGAQQATSSQQLQQSGGIAPGTQFGGSQQTGSNLPQGGLQGNVQQQSGNFGGGQQQFGSNQQQQFGTGASGNGQQNFGTNQGGFGGSSGGVATQSSNLNVPQVQQQQQQQQQQNQQVVYATVSRGTPSY